MKNHKLIWKTSHFILKNHFRSVLEFFIRRKIIGHFRRCLSIRFFLYRPFCPVIHGPKPVGPGPDQDHEKLTVRGSLILTVKKISFSLKLRSRNGQMLLLKLGLC